METADEILYKGLLEIEYIADKRENSDGKVEYFLKWKGYRNEENTWETPSKIEDKKLIEEFEKKCLDNLVEKNKKLFCEICEKSFNSEKQANDHYESRNHIKKVSPQKLKRSHPSVEVPPPKKAKTTPGNFGKKLYKILFLAIYINRIITYYVTAVKPSIAKPKSTRNIPKAAPKIRPGADNVKSSNAVAKSSTTTSKQLVHSDHKQDSVKNIFDSHCHLDRTFSKIFGTSKKTFFDEKSFRNEFGNFGAWEFLKYEYNLSESLEGIINVITNPRYFDEKFWNWIAKESNVYLAIGCHPSDAQQYDPKADFELEKGKQIV